MVRTRMFPDKPLGVPLKRWDDTFSAQTVMLDAFFKQHYPVGLDRREDGWHESGDEMIYGYVPIETVLRVIESHGGMATPSNVGARPLSRDNLTGDAS